MCPRKEKTKSYSDKSKWIYQDTWVRGHAVFECGAAADVQVIEATSKSKQAFCDPKSLKWRETNPEEVVVHKIWIDSVCAANDFIDDMLMAACFPTQLLLPGRKEQS